MKKIFITAMTVVSLVGLLFAPAVLAQTETMPGSKPPDIRPPASTPAPSMALLPSKAVFTSDLIGAEVKSPQGESLGKVAELVVDRQEMRVTSAVVSVGGVLGIGSKSVAIPWREVMLEDGGKTLVVAMSRDEIGQAPDWKKPDGEAMPTARPPASQPITPR
jgi:sporulation protein YlmC with PRC-barrel domain